MIAWWLVALASAKCPAAGGPGCLEKAERLAERGREARAGALYRRACTAAHLASCAPLFTRDEPAAERVLTDVIERCEGGDDEACTTVGAFLAEDGPSVRWDYAEAQRLLELACIREHGPACAKSAEMATWGEPYLPRDLARARVRYAHACALEHAPSCRELGTRRMRGFGLPPDAEGAYEAMAQACALEDAEGCQKLGWWHVVGRGQPADPRAGAERLAEACAHSDDGGACLWAAARVTRADPVSAAVPRAPIVAAAEERCRGGAEPACAALWHLSDEPAVSRAESADVVALACRRGAAGACARAASDPDHREVADQLEAEVRRLQAAHTPERVLTTSAAPPGWVPDAEAMRACMAETIRGLAAPRHQGRGSPSPGQARAADWLAQRMEAVGLEVSRPPVPIHYSGESWLEVDGQRIEALSVPGAPVGVFSGRVRVLEGPPGPGVLTPGSEGDDVVAIVFGVPRLVADQVPEVSADVPVLAVASRALGALSEGAVVAGRAVREGEVPQAVNVVGVLPGRGSKAAEAVVLGAHYDAQGSGFDSGFRQGADDNASGTAAIVCIAEALGARLEAAETRRTFVFAAFTAEEHGLFGSRAFVRERTVDGVVAMANLDMIGRVRDDRLEVRQYGAWEERLAAASQEVGLDLVEAHPRGTSDHLPFVVTGVPAFHLFSGVHGDYHRPTDTLDRVNVRDAARAAQIAGSVVGELATGPVPGPVTDPCTEMTLGELQAGTDPGAFEPPRARQVRCVVPGGIGEALGLQRGDYLYGLGPFREAWPLERARLFVQRGAQCLRLELGEAPRDLPCEALP